jgi:hypothetical protein
MKKIVIGISFIAFLVCGSFAFAQMGGGMKEGQKSGAHHAQMMEQGGMMEHGQMMGDMMDMSNQMSEMMGKMSGMMKDMPKGNRKMMSGVLKDISHQMMDMSTVMGSGKVSAKKMKKMHDRMMEIQKRMSGMDMHK